ncbi:MAG: hypothetical protein KDI74_08055 [Gammaproteobacteria bacterium]|nr:hypothetical protein [Gammaproteobacteria bacterium]
MNEMKTRISRLLNELQQEKDELRLKMKLAELEASGEWLKLEAKLTKLEAKTREVGNATAEASKDIGIAAKLLGEEIREGFRKIAGRF